MEKENSLFIPNISDIVCFVKFFLILYNCGKRIYCNYYTEEFKTTENQLEFEKEICKISIKNMVDKSDLDIINYSHFNILCKINKEISIFIGQDENDNEILLEKLYNEFESQLFNIVQDDLSREKILNSYDKLILVIDEMIIGGIVLNINNDSLYNRIFENKVENSSNNENKNNSSKINFMSNWLGFWGGGNK